MMSLDSRLTASPARITAQMLAGGMLIDKVALGDADTPGGILVWPNPLGADIVVTDMLLVASAQPTDPTLGLLVATPAGAQGNMNSYSVASFANPIAYGNGPLGLHAGEALTISRDPAGGSAAGFAGYAYISWFAAQV